VIDHVVFLAVRPGTPDASVETMLRALRGLSGKIPVVRELTAGPTVTDRGRQFTHGLLVRFGSRADLDTYLAHPAHVAVVEEFVKPIADDVLVLDWETR